MFHFTNHPPLWKVNHLKFFSSSEEITIAFFTWKNYTLVIWLRLTKKALKLVVGVSNTEFWLSKTSGKTYTIKLTKNMNRPPIFQPSLPQSEPPVHFFTLNIWKPSLTLCFLLCLWGNRTPLPCVLCSVLTVLVPVLWS